MRNYSIQELILESFQEKVEQKNTRDIGKFLQFVAEGYARRWLKEECGIHRRVLKMTQMEMKQLGIFLQKKM